MELLGQKDIHPSLMNSQTVFNAVGILLLLLSGLLLVPLGVSLYFHTPAMNGHVSGVQAFSLTAAVSFFSGLALWKLLPFKIENLRDREGFAIVAFSWIFVALLGAFPYLLTGVCPAFIDALFESVSGFTTTGATVLLDIDAAPKEILFWRSLTQWLGGMGIIVLSLAVFPILGVGSFHLFKAEIPGGETVERIQPHLAETARILWGIYLALTALETLLLWLGGMSLFDAVCHSLTTLSTGGYTPHNGSVGFFNSLYIEGVVAFFLFLAGINFALHSQLFSKNFQLVFKNLEFRVYCSIIVISILLATWDLMRTSPDLDGAGALRKSFFNIISVFTTTGFVTEDFNQWPNFLKVLLFGLMVVGGCHGSTSGSLKVTRYIILFKITLQELRKLVHPQGVFPVKVGEKIIDPEDQTNVVALTFMFFALSALGYILLSLMDIDMATSLSATLACFTTTGPGLAQVGPASNYAGVPYLAKALLIFYMLMGRLEIYAIMLLFMPITWRK